MSSNVDVVECTAPTQLFDQYLDEPVPRPTYIELDLRSGQMFAESQDEIGKGVPKGVYDGFRRRYDIPILTAKAANRLLHKLAPLADRILSDWHDRWDGSDHLAVLGEDASNAEQDIFDLTGLEGFPERDVVACWDLDDALNGKETAKYGITGSTSNERLQEISDDIVGELASNSINSSGIAVCPGLTEHLQLLRDAIAREELERAR